MARERGQRVSLWLNSRVRLFFSRLTAFHPAGPPVFKDHTHPRLRLLLLGSIPALFISTRVLRSPRPRELRAGMVPVPHDDRAHPSPPLSCSLSGPPAGHQIRRYSRGALPPFVLKGSHSAAHLQGSTVVLSVSAPRSRLRRCGSLLAEQRVGGLLLHVG